MCRMVLFEIATRLFHEMTNVDGNIFNIYILLQAPSAMKLHRHTRIKMMGFLSLAFTIPRKNLSLKGHGLSRKHFRRLVRLTEL
jgi:hypothetical protein